LNEAIRRWQENLGASPAFGRDNLEELASHLRASVGRLKATGLSEEEAFVIAARRIGEQGALEREYAKVNWAVGWSWAMFLFWIVAGIYLIQVVSSVVLGLNAMEQSAEERGEWVVRLVTINGSPFLFTQSAKQRGEWVVRQRLMAGRTAGMRSPQVMNYEEFTNQAGSRLEVNRHLNAEYTVIIGQATNPASGSIVTPGKISTPEGNITVTVARRGLSVGGNTNREGWIAGPFRNRSGLQRLVGSVVNPAQVWIDSNSLHGVPWLSALELSMLLVAVFIMGARLAIGSWRGFGACLRIFEHPVRIALVLALPGLLLTLLPDFMSTGIWGPFLPHSAPALDSYVAGQAAVNVVLVLGMVLLARRGLRKKEGAYS